MKRNFLMLASVLCLLAAGAHAQSSPFVGTWHCQTTTAGSGGYAMLIDMEEVFQPDGKFSALSSSYYTNGMARGAQIGATQSTGTYKVDASQGILSFHNTSSHSTNSGAALPSDENDRFQFTSSTAFTLQSLNGGPILTFTRAQ